jgi:hypothetical protein
MKPARPNLNIYQDSVNGFAIPFVDGAGDPFNLDVYSKIECVQFASLNRKNAVDEFEPTVTDNVLSYSWSSADTAEKFTKQGNVIEFRFFSESDYVVLVVANVILGNAYKEASISEPTIAVTDGESTVILSDSATFAAIAQRAANSAKQIQAEFGILPNFISTETGTLPDSTGAVADTTKGAYFTDDDIFQLVLWDGDAWQDVGEPVSTKKYVDDKTSFLAEQTPSSGFLPLRGVTLEETDSEVVPVASRLNDGKLYGTLSQRLYVSENEGESWTMIGPDFGATPRLLLDAGEGEIVLIFSNTVRKSSGWGESNFTVTTTLENPTDSSFLPWGADSVPDDGLIVVTHYRAGSESDFEESRFVWLSQDNGTTWSIIRDLDSDNKNDRHLHFAAFDPFNGNRIWISHHQQSSETGSGKSIEYSDDLGQTWIEIPIEVEWNGAQRDVQPTTATATKSGMVLGSDDTFTGLFIVRPEEMRVQILSEGPQEDAVTQVRSFATYSQIDPKTGIVYICFNQQIASALSFIMASDGRTGSVVFSEEEPLPILSDGVGGLPGFSSISLSESKIFARARRPSVADPTVQSNWLLTAEKSKKGFKKPLDLGKILGGRVGAGNTRSTAIGFGSRADGLMSFAAGYKAHAQSGNIGLAVGPNSISSSDRGHAVGVGAEAASQAVSFGYLAIASGTAVAIGDSAEASSNCVAVGRNSKALSNSVTVGEGSEITAGGNSVAVGRTSKAGNSSVSVGRESLSGNNSVSVGANADASGNNSVAIGDGVVRIPGNASYVAIGRNASAATNSVALGRDTVVTEQFTVGVGPRDIEVQHSEKGVILLSPNGTRYRITVDDAGELTTMTA